MRGSTSWLIGITIVLALYGGAMPALARNTPFEGTEPLHGTLDATICGVTDTFTGDGSIHVKGFQRADGSGHLAATGMLSLADSAGTGVMELTADAVADVPSGEGPVSVPIRIEGTCVATGELDFRCEITALFAKGANPALRHASPDCPAWLVDHSFGGVPWGGPHTTPGPEFAVLAVVVGLSALALRRRA